MKLSKISNRQLKGLIDDGHIRFSNPITINKLINLINSYEKQVEKLLWDKDRGYLATTSYEIKGKIRKSLDSSLWALQVHEGQLYRELDKLITSLKRLSHKTKYLQ